MTDSTNPFTDSFEKYLDFHGYYGTPFVGYSKGPRFWGFLARIWKIARVFDLHLMMGLLAKKTLPHAAIASQSQNSHRSTAGFFDALRSPIYLPYLIIGSSEILPVRLKDSKPGSLYAYRELGAQSKIRISAIGQLRWTFSLDINTIIAALFLIKGTIISQNFPTLNSSPHWLYMARTLVWETKKDNRKTTTAGVAQDFRFSSQPDDANSIKWGKYEAQRILILQIEVVVFGVFCNEKASNCSYSYVKECSLES